MLELVCSVFQFWPEEESLTAYWVRVRSIEVHYFNFVFPPPTGRIACSESEGCFWNWSRQKRHLWSQVCWLYFVVFFGLLTLSTVLFRQQDHLEAFIQQRLLGTPANSDRVRDAEVLVQGPQFAPGPRPCTTTVVSRLVFPMDWLHEEIDFEVSGFLQWKNTVWE